MKETTIRRVIMATDYMTEQVIDKKKEFDHNRDHAMKIMIKRVMGDRKKFMKKIMTSSGEELLLLVIRNLRQGIDLGLQQL
jgi:hypothetical protein